MLLIATSDKGGTGRSVTSSNVVYRRALQGDHVAYVDFDFGSPTAGAVLGVSSMNRGTESGRGTHNYLRGNTDLPEACDVWGSSGLRLRPAGSGRLVLFPGDAGGGEFASTADVVERCVNFFLRLREEFDVTVIDLSAGRSYAAEIVLKATSAPSLATPVASRWLIFHRWTAQHIIAAHGLVHGQRGLLDLAVQCGIAEADFLEAVRYVRTAVVDPGSPDMAGLRPPQLAWLGEKDRQLQQLAARNGLGPSSTIGVVPLDPVLQWQEQLITDDDVWAEHVANPQTVSAFENLAKALDSDEAWERL